MMPSEKTNLRGSYLCGEDLHKRMMFVDIKDLPKAMILRREAPTDRVMLTEKTYLRKWCPQRRPT